MIMHIALDAPMHRSSPNFRFPHRCSNCALLPSNFCGPSLNDEVSMNADDITLQLPWDHLEDTIMRLDVAQDLSNQPVEPSPSCVAPSDSTVHQCDQCDFVTTDVTVFRRHCTSAHGCRTTRTQFAVASNFSTWFA